MPKLFLACLLLLGLTGFAQDPATKTPPLPKNTPASPDTAQDFSKQPIVVEQFVNRYRWQPDGTGVRQTILRAKVQSALGVQQLGQVPIGYSSANESVKINYVRVRKPGGEVVTVPESSVQDLTAPVAREAPMYSDYRVKQIIVPGLEPGDTLEYDIAVSIIKPLAQNQFWMEHNFNKDNILLDEQLEVDVPSAVKVTLKTNTGFDPKVETRKDRRLYIWRHKNLAIEDDGEDDDSSKTKKRRKKDDNDPDKHPDVQMTTFQSWAQLGDWYADLVKERAQPSDAVKARALELTKGKSSDEEKVEALYDYVSKQYRYISLSFGIGRYQPHPAAEIFSNRYGDCKDKFTLLAAMLQAVGIHSDPVLIHSWRHLDEAVPSPAQFDHVISAVMIGGKPMIVDATPEVAPFGLLSPTLRHKKALLVEAKSTHLIDTPATLPFPPSQIVELNGKVNDIGKLDGSVRVTTRGDSELAFRAAFRQVPQGKWNQLAKYFLSAMGIDGEATDVKASPVEDTSKPFEVSWKVAAANYLDWTNKSVDLRPMAGGTNLPQFAEETDSERQKSLQIYDAPSSVLYRVSIKLPDGYKVTLPVPVSLARDYGKYTSRYTLDAATNTVNIEREFKFTVNEVPYARRGDYTAFQRGIAADEQQKLHIETKAAENAAIPSNMKADDLMQAANNALQHDNPREAARLLERVVELEPKHQSAWNNLGLAYMQMSQLDKAEKAFRKQAEINPYDEYSYNNLGRVLWQKEDYEGAITAFKKQLEVQPLDKMAHANLGALYLQRKRYQEAVPELETTASLIPDAAGVHTQLGTAYLNTGAEDKAMSEYAKAVQLTPAPSIWNDIAYELTEKGVQLDRARSYAESAVNALSAELRNVDLDHLSMQDLANTSSLSAAWDTLGWVYFKQGDLPKALSYILAAWKVAQHSDIADHLGTIYAKMGKADESKHYYLLAAAARNAGKDAHDHATKALGSEAALTAALPQAKSELDKMRQQSVPTASAQKAGSADFFLLFDGSGQVASAKYVRGDDGLKSVESSLAKSQISTLMPDGPSTKIVRRASVSCTNGKPCSLTLVPVEETNTLN